LLLAESGVDLRLARRAPSKKVAGSAQCSIKALPEFGPKPELQRP